MPKQKDKQKKSLLAILTRTLLGLGFLGLLLAIMIPVGAYLYISKSLPKVDTLADYRPPIITRVLSDDGSVIAELFEERRIIAPVSKMPKQLVQAFVAAEDANFVCPKSPRSKRRQPNQASAQPPNPNEAANTPKIIRTELILPQMLIFFPGQIHTPSIGL